MLKRFLVISLLLSGCLQIEDGDLREAQEDERIDRSYSQLEKEIIADQQKEEAKAAADAAAKAAAAEAQAAESFDAANSNGDNLSNSNLSSTLNSALGNDSSGNPNNNSNSQNTTVSGFLSNASSLAADQAVTGNTSQVQNYYQVTAQASAMQVSLTHQNPGNGGSNFSVVVLDRHENQIDAFNAFSGINQSSTVGVVSGQTYYIGVLTNTAQAGESYQLQTQFHNQGRELEPNNDFDEAHSLTEGSGVLGKKHTGDTQDFFKVTPSTSRLNLSLQHLSEGQADSSFSIIIYDANQQQVDTLNALQGSSTAKVISVQANQTYFLNVLLNGAADLRGYQLNASP